MTERLRSFSCIECDEVVLAEYAGEANVYLKEGCRLVNFQKTGLPYEDGPCLAVDTQSLISDWTGPGLEAPIRRFPETKP